MRTAQIIHVTHPAPDRRSAPEQLTQGSPRRPAGRRELFALEKPALRFYEGELVVVTGESGAGKSALLEGIARSCRAQWGWMGQAGARYGESAELSRPMGRCCAVVHRKSYFDPRKSVLENVNLPLSIAGLGGPRWTAKVRRAMELLELSLDERPLGPMEDLHPEFRQRLGWARALALDPQLLVVDDAMTSLRDSIRRQLLAEIQERVQNCGSVIYATRTMPKALELDHLRWLHLKAGAVVHDEEFVKEETGLAASQLTRIEHASIQGGAESTPTVQASVAPNAQQSGAEQSAPATCAPYLEQSRTDEDAPTLLSQKAS